ncbi:peptidoglycan recognition protein 6 isoform X2 [Esox lucius]|uniref:peptidoglycan recognition protein 6 isoform X2 n=1 Tax=Esox lucius TaxID=8010 RepID=UPI0014768E9E|nr:peptidoglycan recognition protein 6 isoform X2 [Esox lucius]
MEQQWIWCLAILMVSVHSDAEVSLSQHMDDFISVVEQVENRNAGLDPLAVLRGLRRAAGHTDEFIQHFLGTIKEDGISEVPVMDSHVSDFIGRALLHSVTEKGREEGVVLTADGTTVAVSPVLLGIEAGLLPKARSHVRGWYPLTLARNLGLSFQHYHRSVHSQRLGPDGCWDKVTSPQAFTLSDRPSFATDAMVNGGMDGMILGKKVSAQSWRPLKLSSLLRGYYCHRLDREGLDAAPRLISRLRRENFRKLVRPSILQKQVVKSLVVHQRLIHNTTMLSQEKKELTAVVKEGIQEFVHRYMECPAIIPRCHWGAEPYRGTPTLLSLPLSFMYIHHTYQPSQPCLSFQQCSADMRSMQRFHQDDRGWDDIGYSFVAGSDGYLYEGRGWHWRGAHTKGYNSKGYGVSFIGDYTSSLPSQQTMELVRDRLASCAVSGGRLTGNFTIHGHRQLVNTTCPGDALYSEITGWKHFGVRTQYLSINI